MLMAGVFLAAYYIPLENPRVTGAILEAFYMLQDYAQKHVLTCLVPAFFIAGAISVFVSQASVLKYFGAGANKILSYGVASFSGTVLSVCSCTVLPLFAGIYTRGAGIGPATAFLYSGPEPAQHDCYTSDYGHQKDSGICFSGHCHVHPGPYGFRYFLGLTGFVKCGRLHLEPFGTKLPSLIN